LIRTAKLVVLVLIFLTSRPRVTAEPVGAAPIDRPETPLSPTAEVRAARSWEYGPFAFYGNGLNERSDYRFFAAGVQAGKILTPELHAGILSGQFELAGNIMPIWQAYTPAAHSENFGAQSTP